MRELLVFLALSFVFRDSVSRSSSISEFMLCAAWNYLFKVAAFFPNTTFDRFLYYRPETNLYWHSISGQDEPKWVQELPGSASLTGWSYWVLYFPPLPLKKKKKRQWSCFRQMPPEQIFQCFPLASFSSSHQCLISATVPSCSRRCSRRCTESKLPGWRGIPSPSDKGPAPSWGSAQGWPWSPLQDCFAFLSIAHSVPGTRQSCDLSLSGFETDTFQ